jgi:beta-glucanase (GH16 family)
MGPSVSKGWQGKSVKKIVPIAMLTIILALGAAIPGHADPAGEKRASISSGRVNTNNKFTFTYGRIEASIKLPKTANGLWPAFWMLGADFSDVGWPRCGEIDIMEMGHKAGIDNNVQDRFLTGATHWGTLRDGAHPHHALSTISGYSLQDDNFHLYTLVWDETKIKMYLDANPAPYFVMDIANAQLGGFFHKPYFIVFNLAVGGDFPQIYDIGGISALNADNAYRADMYIDFVNVYDKNGTPLWLTDFDEEVLDESKWNIEEDDLGGGNHELQSYRRGNVFLAREPKTGKNCLVLSARKY